jgi:CTP:molybdopterin cytidylyltransferase MocA/predicted hydrolase (HD superfamily)
MEFLVLFDINISVLVLAAGRSTRFHPNHKALPAPWGPGLMGRAFETFSLLGLTQPLVVVGHRALEVRAEALKLGGRTVENINYDLGMFSSVKAGFDNLDPGQGVLVFPVDASFVSAAAVLSVIASWLENGRQAPQTAVIPAYGQKLGHPPLIGRELLPKIMGFKGPGGLRGALANLAGDPNLAQSIASGLSRQGLNNAERAIKIVNLPDPMLLSDVDTPEDLKAALAKPKWLPENPTPWEAMSLMRLMKAPEIKKRHSLSVAAAALRLALALGSAREELAFTGGLCHDLDRSQAKHDLKVRARFLAIGWPELAAVVGAHTELPEAFLKYIGYPGSSSDRHKDIECSYSKLTDDAVEAALCVHLADKYVEGIAPVSLEKRFDPTWARQDPMALKAIERRLRVARHLEAWFARRIGASPSKVALTRCRHSLEHMAEQLALEFSLNLPVLQKNRLIIA